MLALFYKLKDNNYGRFLLLLLCLLAVMPFVTHYYLTKRSGSHSTYFESFHTRSTLQDDGNSEYKLDELRKNIYELEHVKLSLKNELRELEGKRHGLLRNIQEHSNNIDSIRNKAGHLTNEVSKRQQELEDLRFAKQMVDRCPQLPLVKPPKDIFSKLSNSFRVFPKVTAQERNHCKLSSCFDYQKCPLGHDFAAHIYKPQNLLVIALEMYGILKSMPYAVDVSEPTACVYVVIIDKSSQSSPTELERFLYSLKFWQGDGRNHILINVAGVNLKSVDTGRAILAQTIFTQDTPYRRKFDIVLPPFASLLKYGAAWENSAPQLPANRKYLVTFEGNYHNLKKDPNNNSLISGHDLKELSLEAKDIFIQTSCRVTKEFAEYNGWQLCQSHTSRAELLKASTFVLIIHSEHSNDQTVTMRFIEALQYGAVPVLISDDILLPFADIIDWERAAIMLHTAQFPQVHFILRTILVNDLLDIRRQGRFLWETYLSSTKSVLTSAIAVMQTRLSLPGLPAKDTHFPSVFRDGNEPVFYTPNAGVMQHRMKAATFYRNFSANTIYARQRWNTYPGALLLYPSSPFVPVLPSSAAFLNSSVDIQPIGKGAGGAGVEFQKALGGDYPFEQFTIVMLTYERELVLIEALGRLAGLQYLNKVVVIWNSPGDPSPDLKWPNIGVPVKVLRPDKNSLNNRFLPLDEIETDAVLSMDDDIQLRHDEILFGFRVWREVRERIVGFPGRYHAWDASRGGWRYNSNHSCELSMVLTGAAFLHKYYTYLYTYVMPRAIREKVDEYTNCEDIAMNFLVSHVTRKPPIKVTSRWTFRCPGCPVTLYQDKTHFNERHECINFFVKVFGYMPLLRTQFRADSVLFKTRIPSDKSKCFQYI